MRDLVAVSTLPAVWVGLGLDGIARSLADVLLKILSAEIIYVRLQAHTGQRAIEVVRTSDRREDIDVETVKGILVPILTSDRIQPPATVPNPFGKGSLRIAVSRFGVGDDFGVVVAGSLDDSFPSDQDRLLLGVAANQTAIIAQRRATEEQVRDQQEWLRVTLASIGDAVIATDTEGRITFLNPIAQELTGWMHQGAQGKPLTAVFRIINENSRQSVENPVDRVLREGTVVGLANHTVLIAGDGTERPIDDSAAPIRDATGKMIGVVLIFRDVTHGRRSEQQRNARLAATQILNVAQNVDEGITGVLQAVSENLAWDVGCFWTVNGDTLQCSKIWHRPDVSIDRFKKTTLRRTFEEGARIAGACVG